MRFSECILPRVSTRTRADRAPACGVSRAANIISWCLVYFVASFQDPFPWKGENGSFENSREFLFDEVLHAADDDQLDAGKSYVISGYVYAGLVATWAFVFFALVFGVKGVSKVVAVTVPLPILLLVILLIYNSTLDGAKDGVVSTYGRAAQNAFSPRNDAVLLPA